MSLWQKLLQGRRGDAEIGSEKEAACRVRPDAPRGRGPQDRIEMAHDLLRGLSMLEKAMDLRKAYEDRLCGELPGEEKNSYRQRIAELDRAEAEFLALVRDFLTELIIA